MVCVDNSEFTRNGDYAPTRFQAQADAVNLLAGAKTQHHPENTVGVLTMAGKTPQVQLGQRLQQRPARLAPLGNAGSGPGLAPAASLNPLLTQSCCPYSWSAGAGHAHPRSGQGAQRDAGDED